METFSERLIQLLKEETEGLSHVYVESRRIQTIPFVQTDLDLESPTAIVKQASGMVVLATMDNKALVCYQQQDGETRANVDATGRPRRHKYLEVVISRGSELTFVMDMEVFPEVLTTHQRTRHELERDRSWVLKSVHPTSVKFLTDYSVADFLTRSSSTDADGPAWSSRLRHLALALVCNWPGKRLIDMPILAPVHKRLHEAIRQNAFSGLCTRSAAEELTPTPRGTKLYKLLSDGVVGQWNAACLLLAATELRSDVVSQNLLICMAAIVDVALHSDSYCRLIGDKPWRSAEFVFCAPCVRDGWRYGIMWFALGVFLAYSVPESASDWLQCDQSIDELIYQERKKIHTKTGIECIPWRKLGDTIVNHV